MSLLYIDGFDDYSNTTGVGHRLYERAANLWSLDGTAQDDQGDTTTMPGISSGRGLRLNWKVSSNAGPHGLLLVLPEDTSSGVTMGFGFHFRMDVLPVATRSMFGLSTTAGTPQLSLQCSNGGILTVSNSIVGSALTGATSVDALAINTTYHIELKVLFHASAGTVEVRVDGVPWITATGVNTFPAASQRAHFLPSTTSTAAQQDDHCYFDNFYIWNDSGSINNDCLGPRFVETLFPNADTADADWTLSTGSDGFDLINDVLASDLVYIESSTPGDRSVFDLGALTATQIDCNGVQMVCRALKTEAGDGPINFGIKHDSSESLNEAVALTEDSSTKQWKLFETNPSTAAKFTANEVNSLQAIIEYDV